MVTASTMTHKIMSAGLNFYVPQALLEKDLSGQNAIVTGATGSFGAVVSETLVKQGAPVILAVRRLDAGLVLGHQFLEFCDGGGGQGFFEASDGGFVEVVAAAVF